MAEQDQKPTILFNRDRPQWPMTYALRRLSDDTPPRRWWRHYYYESPRGQKVQVLYSKTKSHSERLAKLFANEPVLGFDMEWPRDANKRPRLQDKVALIQLASERRVALFHIALHEGKAVDDLIAPTLKRIIESPEIMKTGVAVMNADFRRLKVYFNLEPKGAFELSHLHNLVTYGAAAPHLVTTKLCSLSAQVKEHLGLPLWKGNARTSDWSQPLSWDQTQYAATDAYACFMLFHCMNAKRLAMDTVPPFPRLAETYPPFDASRSNKIQLELLGEDGQMRLITAEDFFRPMNDIRRDEGINNWLASNSDGISGSAPKIPDDIQGDTGVDGENGGKVYPGDGGPTPEHIISERDHSPAHEIDRKSRKKAKERGNRSVRTSMDSSCWSLYGRLASHRKRLAVSKDIAPFQIAHNTVLQALTLHRPSNERELLLIPGIGKRKAAQYGASWLGIIAEFERERRRDNDIDKQKEADDQETDGGGHQKFESQEPKRRRIVRVGRSKELVIPSGELPVILNTGLSFQFGEASLADEPQVSPQHTNQGDPDGDDSVFGPPMELPSLSVLKRRRNVASSNFQRQPSPPRNARQTAPTPGPVLSVKAEPTAGPMLVSSVDPERSAVEASISAPTPRPTPTPSLAVPSQHLRVLNRRPDYEMMILRKKLEAYTKSVVWAMDPKPSEPLVSEGTLQYLITKVPQTAEEFHRAPGIRPLINACDAVNMDVWRTFEKWTQNLRPGPSTGPR